MPARAEYPRPQFQRADWLNLNGGWEFEFDPGDSGRERDLVDRPLSGWIEVPFCPEAPRSGIENGDFHQAVWYRTRVEIPLEWAPRAVLLHFGAVDYDATVWVNGVEVVRHRGGFTPFTAELAGVVEPGRTATIVVRARDDSAEAQPRGKQSTRYANGGCYYTRTTGVWQTVWLEPVPAVRLERPRITPNLADATLHFELPVSANRANHHIRCTVADELGAVGESTVNASLDRTPRTTVRIPGDRVRPWSPEDPHLYGVRLQLLDGQGAVVDEATSYAGLRSVAIDGTSLLLNGKPVFQRLVLDQGWYPDGLLTAPTDAALRRDIELAVAAGFNGARLHQKVFEERFLYHADRLGYLVWGEFGDWGCSTGTTGTDNQRPTPSYVAQWLEALHRDYSHPCIVGWCPLNETHQKLHDRISVLDDVTRGMFLATKAFDTSRPVLDASGYAHRVPESDVYDSHSYEQDPGRFRAQMSGLAEAAPFINADPDGSAWSIGYRGQPYFCSEFGGIWWNPDTAAEVETDSGPSWGYGQRPASEEEVQHRFAALTGVLLKDPHMFGYCYTQLTDVFQEQNGIYRFDRSAKLDVTRIRAAQQRPAATESDEC